MIVKPALIFQASQHDCDANKYPIRYTVLTPITVGVQECYVRQLEVFGF